MCRVTPQESYPFSLKLPYKNVSDNNTKEQAAIKFYPNVRVCTTSKENYQIIPQKKDTNF